MLGKIFLVIFGFLTIINIGFTLPKSSGTFINFTHINDDGSFYLSYHRKDNNEAASNTEFKNNQTDKIYGGSYAAEGQFPFMVIIHRLAGNGQYFVCGGSILSKRWVLTAGHCVANKPQKFLVVFGVVDKSGFGYDYITGEGAAMIANQGALHPGFGSGRNDIGLLYMPRDIPFGENIQPIRIAGKSYRSRYFTNTMAYVFGWGKDDQDGSAVKRLKYGRVPIIPHSMCRRTWNVDATHVCTDASVGEDVCQGDSGGPLVVMESDDEPLQIGIVSYGDANCPSARPSVFTRVSMYATWIRKVTGIDYE